LIVEVVACISFILQRHPSKQSPITLNNTESHHHNKQQDESAVGHTMNIGAASLDAEEHSDTRTRLDRMFRTYRREFYQFYIIILLSIGLFGYSFGRRLDVALPYMRSDTNLNIDDLEVTLLVVLGGLAFGIGKVVAGVAADKLGGKVVFVSCLLLSAMWNAALSMSRTFAPVCVFWTLNMAFSSAAWCSLTVLVSRWFENERIGRAFGLLACAHCIGGLASTLLFGVLIDNDVVAWRGMFSLGALVTFAAAITVLALSYDAPHMIELQPPWTSVTRINSFVGSAPPYRSRGSNSNKNKISHSNSSYRDEDSSDDSDDGRRSTRRPSSLPSYSSSLPRSNNYFNAVSEDFSSTGYAPAYEHEHRHGSSDDTERDDRLASASQGRAGAVERSSSSGGNSNGNNGAGSRPDSVEYALTEDDLATVVESLDKFECSVHFAYSLRFWCMLVALASLTLGSEFSLISPSFLSDTIGATPMAITLTLVAIYTLSAVLVVFGGYAIDKFEWIESSVVIVLSTLLASVGLTLLSIYIGLDKSNIWAVCSLTTASTVLQAIPYWLPSSVFAIKYGGESHCGTLAGAFDGIGVTMAVALEFALRVGLNKSQWLYVLILMSVLSYIGTGALATFQWLEKPMIQQTEPKHVDIKITLGDEDDEETVLLPSNTHTAARSSYHEF
jgi:hypothetical protein